MTTFTTTDRLEIEKSMEIEEVILALKAAGWATPNYEILSDGSVYYYYGEKTINPLFPITEPRNQDGSHAVRDE